MSRCGIHGSELNTAGKCGYCELKAAAECYASKPDTVTLPRETDLSGTTRARIGKDGTLILRHFNCDETNEFYLTALETKALYEVAV